MEQHEIDAELASALDLIDGTQAAHLGYVAPDGTPRTVPVGFLWTGTEFVVSTAPTAPKVAALRARPDVALTMDAGGTTGAARTLSVRGRATLRTVDGPTEEYVAAARRSMPPEQAEEFVRRVTEMYDQQVRIGIVPTWARFWDFDAGRIPAFLRELAERNG